MRLNVWWGLMSYDIEENGCVQIKTISSICLKRLISSHLLQKKYKKVDFFGSRYTK
jgi:hypothetical protein